jgi:hypothetical protein
MSRPKHPRVPGPRVPGEPGLGTEKPPPVRPENLPGGAEVPNPRPDERPEAGSRKSGAPRRVRRRPASARASDAKARPRSQRLATSAAALALAACIGDQSPSAGGRRPSPHWESGIVGEAHRPSAEPRFREGDVCREMRRRVTLSILHVPTGVVLTLERGGGVTMRELDGHAASLEGVLSPTNLVEWGGPGNECYLRELAVEADEVIVEPDVAEVRVRITTSDPDRLAALRRTARLFVDSVD